MHISLQELLHFFKVNCTKPYYISSGKPLSEYPHKAFRIDFYALCICISGEIFIEIDKEKHILVQNDFLILSPSTYLKFKESTSSTTIKLLFFEKNFLLKNVSNPFIIEKMNLFRNKSFSIVQSSLETKHLLDLLYYLEERSIKESYYRDEIIRTIIFNILLEVADIVNKLPPLILKTPQKQNFIQFRKLVKEFILENHSVDFYASKLCISNKYLIEITKHESGQTPHEIINEFLLKEAYILLGNNSLTINQISEILQFNSSSAFGRFFKKHTTLSPLAYRKKEGLL